ncbi:MAG: filamentous hemagglutinin N-terminal domain-containing protein [Nitrospirales bacterium]
MASSRCQTSLTGFVATLSLVMLAGPDTSHAQITDITSSGLGTEVSIPTTLPNGAINYDITGGSRPGNGPNLFHSFGEFSVGNNNIANFLNETNMPTENILSRVTGGNPSNIFGTLQTTNFGAANLYLINPAGVIFGPTAELNVGGSFAASTADYLKMTDGAKFYADPAQPTVMSIAPVAAFGFTNPRPAGIAVQGSSLQVPTDQSLSLVGGDITVSAGSLTSGRINLVSAASPGEVILNAIGAQSGMDTSTFTHLGEIVITDTLLAADGNGGEMVVPVVLRGGRLTVDNSNILVRDLESDPNSSSPAVDINVTGDASLVGTTVSVKDNMLGGGFFTPNSINLKAGNDLILRNSTVAIESSQVIGGDIRLSAPILIRIVDSTLTTSGGGQAGFFGGNIEIDPQLVVIQNSQLLARNFSLVTEVLLIDFNTRLVFSDGQKFNISFVPEVLSGYLATPNLAYSQPALSGDRCAADPTGQFSSFVQAGRDGVPQVPGALSPSPLSFLDTLTSGSVGSQVPNWAAARLGLNFVSADDPARIRFHSACRS